jgi:hypothetical protein
MKTIFGRSVTAVDWAPATETSNATGNPAVMVRTVNLIGVLRKYQSGSPPCCTQSIDFDAKMAKKAQGAKDKSKPFSLLHPLRSFAPSR